MCHKSKGFAWKCKTLWLIKVKGFWLIKYMKYIIVGSLKISLRTFKGLSEPRPSTLVFLSANSGTFQLKGESSTATGDVLEWASWPDGYQPASNFRNFNLCTAHTSHTVSIQG